MLMLEMITRWQVFRDKLGRLIASFTCTTCLWTNKGSILTNKRRKVKIVNPDIACQNTLQAVVASLLYLMWLLHMVHDVFLFTTFYR